MKYKYLLFDLDGTLVDTREGVFKSAQYALKHFNIFPEMKDMAPFFGPPLKQSFTCLYGLNDVESDRAVELYLERYEKKGVEESKVFDQIPSLLSRLKELGYKLGVATSKYEGHAIETLKYYKLDVYFDYIAGATIDESISKKHEVIEELLKRFGIHNKRSDALMIGDTKYDIIGAKTAGIDSLGIYTGTAGKNELENEGASFVAYSFEELKKLLIDEFA